jgi:glutamyl-tRNA synthetase
MENDILAFALQNALEHEGKANFGSVMGKAMALFPDLRNDPKNTSKMVKKIVGEVNSLGLKQQKDRLEKIGGPIELQKRERKTGLPELKEAENGKVVMRFAPGPSGPLHLGHTRAAILNDEFCKKYDGEFILRLEDTNPEKIDPEAYNMIPEDLNWLGIKVDTTYTQSDRFDEYYNIAKTLMENGSAYVCTMDTELWKELKYAGKPCEERDLGKDIQLEKWEKMLNGTFLEGEASLVIKTDLYHKNPAVRDFVGMRIRDHPHPRTGDRYRVYPLYNLSVVIDDHLMGCSHILRGKDHLNNTVRQRYIYEHLGWNEPLFIHYGLVSIPNTILKTSIIKERIITGEYSGWDDIRLGTIRAIAARGFDPRSLREYWVDVGLKSADIQFSWDNFYSMNRSLIDGATKRFFFVPDPKRIHFTHNETLIAEIPVHVEHPEMGVRRYSITPDNGKIEFVIPSDDFGDLSNGSVIRLKGLCNIKMTDIETGAAEFAGSDPAVVRSNRGKIVQWVHGDGAEMELIMPDGKIIFGIAEKDILDSTKKGENIQFERVGYFRTFNENGSKANFMHP